MTEQEIRDALIYQCGGPEVTTMGPCERGCGGDARGSEACWQCLTDELATHIRRDDAFAFAAALKVGQKMRWEAACKK